MRTITIDNESVPVRLTLGALAEIETVLEAATLTDLAERLAAPSARQLLGIAEILVQAGGDAAAAGRVADADIDLSEVITVISALFRELIGAGLPGKPMAGGSAGGAG